MAIFAAWTPERAGDLRAPYDAAKSKNSFPEQFWSSEYHLNVLIARYPKPVIAIMDRLKEANAAAAELSWSEQNKIASEE